MARQFDPADSGYVDVAARIVEFRTKHPEGSLQPANTEKPFEVVTIGSDTFVAVIAAAYRSPDDRRPGIGMAYESYPGRTPYTRGSELQNAETSAWGRAIVAALAADTKKGIASAEDVRNRSAERETWEQATPARQPEPEPPAPVPPPAEPTPQQVAEFDQLAKLIAAAESKGSLRAAWDALVEAYKQDAITTVQANELKAAVEERKGELPPETAEAESAGGEPTDKQHRRMHALWRDLGLGADDKREERLTRTALVIGRDITTSKELTPAEADKLIESLDRQAKERKSETVGAAA